MHSEISHEGIVQSAEEDSVTVLLSPGISCSGCQAEKSCNITGSDRKIIKFDGSFGIHEGEKVMVSMRRSQGISAVVLGYIIPLLILLASLITLASLSVKELYSGLISTGLIIIYFGLLFLFRNTISSKFTFTLKRA